MIRTSLNKMLPTDPRWISLLASDARIGIFHHPAWSQLMAECYGYRPFIVALSGSNGTLTTGVPLMEINSLFAGKRWVSLPFSDHCCPLYTAESALRELAEGMILLLKNEKVHSLELRGVYPELSAFHTSSEHVIHEIDLRPGKEKVWKKMHEMHRRNIKKAQENDVKIIWGETLEHLENFYHLHLLTRRRQGIPVQPWKFFKCMKKLLLDQEHGFLLLAYKDQQCIAGAIFLYFKDILTYKYGASREDSLMYRPNNLVIWNAIQWGCEHGFTYFDLGRTDLENTGLRIFKSRWGAQETPLNYTSLGSSSIYNGNKRLMRYMQIIIRRSPTWVCRLSGEMLYRQFG